MFAMCSATDSFDIALQLMALFVNRCLVSDQVMLIISPV
jgi:hypothetical protein